MSNALLLLLFKFSLNSAQLFWVFRAKLSKNLLSLSSLCQKSQFRVKGRHMPAVLLMVFMFSSCLSLRGTRTPELGHSEKQSPMFITRRSTISKIVILAMYVHSNFTGHFKGKNSNPKSPNWCRWVSLYIHSYIIKS